jgi:hypothetical protein
MLLLTLCGVFMVNLNLILVTIPHSILQYNLIFGLFILSHIN